MTASDAVVRALGADPAVFRPVYRAHQRILSRRSSDSRRGAKVVIRGITPFQFRCFLCAVFSLMMMQWIRGAASPMFGVALVLTVGAGFLVLDVLFDRFDVLSDTGEYQVIAAHPHDAWSVILAKLAALGRSMAILAACTFTVPAIGAGMKFQSLSVGLTFAVTAAALSATVAAGGMLVSTALVAAGGRRAFLRFQPAAHAAYLAIYFGVIAARHSFARLTEPQVHSLAWIDWALPTFWFAAPVELAAGHSGWSSFARASLALGSMVLLASTSARWLSPRFDERVLEPVRAPIPKRGAPLVRREIRASVRRPPSDRTLGMRAFWRILRAHLRSDAAVRGGFLMAFFLPGLVTGSQVFWTRDSNAGTALAMSVPWMFIATSMLVRTSTSSSQPGAIWFVLTAPDSRLPFSRALETAVRVGLILPGALVASIVAATAGSGPMFVRLAFVALVALLADTSLVVLRALNPALPFSEHVRSHRPFRWSTIMIWATALVGMSVSLVGFVLLARWNAVSCLIPVVYVTAARVALEFWVRSRVRRAAVRTELL